MFAGGAKVKAKRVFEIEGLCLSEREGFKIFIPEV
jgi:hypothetical protein